MRAAIVGALVFALWSVSICSAQSLGEIAKKAADAKAAKDKDGKTKPPPKTITNADLKGAEGLPKPEAETAKPAPAKAASAKDAKTETTPAEPAKPESYWKDRMRALQAKLASDEAELVAARASVEQVEAFIRPDRTMTSIIADNLIQARRRRDLVLAAIVTDKRAISEFEEEARRAGVPPGWLRW